MNELQYFVKWQCESGCYMILTLRDECRKRVPDTKFVVLTTQSLARSTLEARDDQGTKNLQTGPDDSNAILQPSRMRNEIYILPSRGEGGG